MKDHISISYCSVDEAIKKLQALKRKYKDLDLELHGKVCTNWCGVSWEGEGYPPCSCTDVEVTGTPKQKLKTKRKKKK